MTYFKRLAAGISAGLIAGFILIAAACGENNPSPETIPPETTPPAIQQTITKDDLPVTSPSPEPIVITIGNLTDESGVAAIPMSYIDTSVQDMIDYYNENELIPGVQLELLKYDTQFNSGRFVPGYEWLRDKGADLIWNALPPGVVELLERVNQDEFCLFSATANLEPEELDSSYVFCMAVTPEYEAFTFLKWIAENDPDFPKDRPARIGGAAWKEDYSDIWFRSAREYCAANPDQYEWVEGYLTAVKFSWENEIHGLKDCDYIYIPTPPQNFMREYRQAGYGAKFLGTELHVAFNGMIDSSGLWDEADGMLLILAAGWYNDQDDPTIDLINTLLEENYSQDRIEDILTTGAAYRAALRIHMICDIIRETVEQVGAENFSNETLAQTARSWSFNYGNIENFSNFTQTKRFSQNYYGIYEFDVDPSNPKTWQYVKRVDPDWILQATHP